MCQFVAGSAEVPRLTVQEKILLHLSEHPRDESEYEAAPDVTVSGLAGAVRIEPRHVPQNVRPLINRGLVDERMAHVKAGRQRRKVYFLTVQGRSEASRLRARVLETRMELEIGGERQTVALRDAMQEHFRGTPLLGVLDRSSVHGGIRAPVTPEANAPAAGLTVSQQPIVLPSMELAAELASRFDWRRAAEVLEGVIASTPPNQPETLAVAREQLAYARFRTAFQSDTPEAFAELMGTAKESYRTASQEYETQGTWGAPRSLRCAAMVSASGFWTAPTIREKKNLVGEIHRRMREALEAFDRAGEPLEYGRTYILLALTPHQLDVLWDRTAVIQILKDCVESGERAVVALESAGAPEELASACALTAQYLLRYSITGGELSERLKAQATALDYWQKSRRISEDPRFPTDYVSLAGDGTDDAIAIFDRALRRATLTRDRHLVGLAERGMAFQMCWKHFRTDDPTEKLKLLDGGLKHAVEARKQFEALGILGAALTGSFDTEYYRSDYDFHRAEMETDPVKKRAFLDESILICRAELPRAQALGFEALEAGSHAVYESLRAAARLETRQEAKQELLRQALFHARAYVQLIERGGNPLWNLAHGLLASAQIGADLVASSEGAAAAESGLRTAVSDMDRALRLWVEEQGIYERMGETAGYSEIASKQYDLGGLLLRLWDIAKKPDDLRRAAEAFEGAATLYRKTGLRSRAAECLWRVAQAEDMLSDHPNAGRHFRMASQDYEAAGARIPHLEELYKDLGLYMDAWSEIQGARYHHARQEYGKAREFYDRAANLHRFTRRWSAFAPNYAAWASLEKAEELSRVGRADEAIRAFHEAEQLFAQTRRSLGAALPAMEDDPSRQVAEELASASRLRDRYCRARVALEQARISEKRGDAVASSGRYGHAADMFEEMARSIQEEGDRREISLIGTLARAWQTMGNAEANASSGLYEDAARLFDEAKELSPAGPGKTLAVAHGHFARALAAGAAFSETRDSDRHALAIRHLEAAADEYDRVGLPSASQYAKASRLLFDAYAYLDRANQEAEPAAKTRLYKMAERVLQASADGYDRAGYPAKTQQVSRLIARAKEERELAASLSDVLRAPAIASSTIAFPTPTPTHERPVGLDRFEHGDVRASVIVAGPSVFVDEAFTIEIEIVNAGRGLAQLIKLEEIGLDAFDLEGPPESCVVTKDYLDLQGRRLLPLATMEIKLRMKAREPGVFRLAPRILYLDDRSEYRHHEPEVVEVAVTRPRRGRAD